jgi:crotonobetainyl-CoA:carnitine CoA-transferase CaiB-like acyl-CoA transferase
MPDQTGLLAGVRVLDLADEVTVFAARLLGELGADVVRVEDSGIDVLRKRPPFIGGAGEVPQSERSLAHLLYNAGKQSCALDFAADECWPLIARLIATSDVVIAPLLTPLGMRPALDSVPDRVGVVDVVFRRDTEDVATDLTAMAAGGHLVLNGLPEDPPNHPAGDLAYKQTSLVAAEAALALLLAARKGEMPGRVIVSMQEAVNFTTLQTANANFVQWNDFVPSRHTPVTADTTFRSKDGRWTSFTVHPPNWPRFVEWISTVLGSDELAGPEWADLTYRGEHRAELALITARLCAALDQEEFLNQGQERGLLALPVNTVADIALDQHLRDREFFVDVPHLALSREVRMPRSAFRSQRQASAPVPAPSLGEHTAMVLRDWGGLREAEIDDLFRREIARGPRATQSEAPLRTPPRRSVDHADASKGSLHQPLAGVRIVDFTWAIAGPLGTRLLADLGADVVKVESEYRLDPIRYIGVQPPGTMSWNTNGVFNDCSPNKRALTLNLNTPEGVDVVRMLVESADVVISNYTPDRLDRWGLGYDALSEIKPDLIMANLAVMGIRGPRKGWRSYGSGIVAMCGLADLSGFPGRDPICFGALHTDFTVPYFAATQVMAALLHRQATGEDRIESILSDWSSERDKWQAAMTLQQVGVPASPVEDLRDLLERDEAMASDYRPIELNADVTAWLQEEPILWDGERLPLVRAPRWGEHTEEILSGELGFDSDALANLAAKEVLY